MIRLARAGILYLACSIPLFAAGLDREAFSFRSYDLQLNVDPAAQALSARGKIVVRNISDTPQTILILQISSTLEWRMVEVAGQPAQYVTQRFTSDIDHTGSVSEAVVSLPHALAPGVSLELEVGYSGTIPSDATRLTRIGAPKDAADHTEWDRISDSFTAVRGMGHVAWYPMSAEAASLSENQLFTTVGHWRARQAESSMRVRFCWITGLDPDDDAEDHPNVIANGQLEGMEQSSRQETPDGTSATGCSTYRFTNLGLMEPAFVIDELETLSRPGVTVYYSPEHKSYAQSYAAAVEAVLPFVEEWFGKAHEKVQIVELNQPGIAPDESGSMLFTRLTGGSPQELQGALVHQVIHAAFLSRRPWIFEGAAQFGQALWREAHQGRGKGVEFMHTQLPVLVAAQKQECGAEPDPAATTASGSSSTGSSSSNPPRPQGKAAACPHGQPLSQAYDEVYARIKGMYVWWMLRDMVGDQSLRQTLQRYVMSDDREPSYLQRLFKAESSRDMEWFFDDWVYRDRGLADLRVQSVFPRATVAGSYVVTVTVQNQGGAGAEVAIRLLAPAGEQSRRLRVPRESTAVIRIDVAAHPSEAVVNDGSVPESDESNNRLSVP